MSKDTEKDLQSKAHSPQPQPSPGGKDTAPAPAAAGDMAEGAQNADAADQTDGAGESEGADEAEAFSLEDYLRQYRELEEKFSRLNEEKEQLEARSLRLQADFDNFRRRSRADNEEAARRAASTLAEGLLPVLDNFERALCAMADSPDKEGVELIMKQLQAALTAAGLNEIEAEGQDFDPKLHHAVSQTDAGEEGRNKVTLVLQKGYTFGGKLLRAAMVQVGQ